MIRISKLAAKCALALAVTLSGGMAQTNTPTSHTNLLLSASVSLTAYVQTYNFIGTNKIAQTVQPQKIAAKDFVDALIQGASTTNTDLSNAKLYLRVKDVATTNESYDFILKKGDIEHSLEYTGGTTYFVLNRNSSDVFTKRPTGNGGTNVLEYIIGDFYFGTPRGSGTVSGLTKIKSTSVFSGRNVVTLEPKFATFNASVDGSGDVNASDAVYKGTINIGGRKVEVLQSP